MPGRKLGRPSAHRNAMLRGLVTYLLENGSVETTLSRAKEVRSMAEKMITLGKLFDEIAPSFENRNGGYSQIFKIGPRRGDAAEMALIKIVKA